MEKNCLKSLLVINGRIASIDQEHFHRFHGNSVFTTIRYKNNTLEHWDLHYERLQNHAAYFDYKLPKEDILLSNIFKNININNLYKIRVIISKNYYCITLEDFIKYNSNIYNGVSVIISKQIVHPTLRYYKTGNYLPYELALKEAQANNHFEGLLLDHEGFVADGARSGILLYEKGAITRLTGGLKSVMAQVVIKRAQEMGLKITEARLRPKELYGQMLLTNSLFGLVSVGAPQDEIVKKLISQSC